MLLNVENLSVGYGAKRALSEVGFTLARKEVLAIVGESGSGKTTVVRAVMGCLPSGSRVSSGKILFEGRDLLAFGTEERRQICGMEMSMIFQDSGSMINPIRRVGEQFIDYIRAHAPEKAPGEARGMAVSALAGVYLPNPEGVMGLYPFELSGGMSQRVGIAMSMAFSPKILLADEPTSALDVTTQAQIVRQILEVAERHDTAVIIVTHNLGVASYMADKIIVIRDGRIVESGSRDEVIGSPKREYTKQLLSAVPTVGGKPYYAD